MRTTRSLLGWAFFLTVWGHGTLQAGDPRVAKRDPAVFFWYHFREAVLSRQLPKLESLTRFPFEATSSDGKTKKISRSSFAQHFRLLLETPLAAQGKTMRQIITEKEDLSGEERTALKEGEIQVGSFRFRTIKNKCWFVGATDLAGTAETLPPPPPAATAPTGKTPPPLSARPSPLEKTEDTPNLSLFRFYWVEFRQATLDNDVEKIKSLTRFPFETKGPLEDDKTKKFTAKEFDLLWPRLLEADPHSWGPLRDSMKELVDRRGEPRIEEISTESTGQVTVGVFVFRKIKNRWFFTRAVVTE